jgi:hypothetical protein
MKRSFAITGLVCLALACGSGVDGGSSGGAVDLQRVSSAIYDSPEPCGEGYCLLDQYCDDSDNCAFFRGNFGSCETVGDLCHNDKGKCVAHGLVKMCHPACDLTDPLAYRCPLVHEGAALACYIFSDPWNPPLTNLCVTPGSLEREEGYPCSDPSDCAANLQCAYVNGSTTKTCAMFCQTDLDCGSSELGDTCNLVSIEEGGVGFCGSWDGTYGPCSTVNAFCHDGDGWCVPQGEHPWCMPYCQTDTDCVNNTAGSICNLVSLTGGGVGFCGPWDGTYGPCTIPEPPATPACHNDEGWCMQQGPFQRCLPTCSVASQDCPVIGDVEPACYFMADPFTTPVLQVCVKITNPTPNQIGDPCGTYPNPEGFNPADCDITGQCMDVEDGNGNTCFKLCDENSDCTSPVTCFLFNASFGICVCFPEFQRICGDNAVYWLDTCNVRGEKIEDCSGSCTDGACVP